MQIPQQKTVRRAAWMRLWRRAGASLGRVAAVGHRDDPRIQPGDYFCSGRSLYRVEHLCGDRVLIEDCVSGDLIDIDREICVALERIQPSA
jgi:hypothetical protein